MHRGNIVGWVNRQMAAAFVVATFALTWAVLGPAALAVHGFGTATVSGAARTLATFAPTIVAVVLIGVAGGKRALGALVSAVGPWHIPVWPTVFALTLPQASCALAFLVYAWSGHDVPQLDAWSTSLVYTALLLPLTALFEEVGWRYLLLNELQRRFTPLRSVVVLALIWGIWHLPMYFMNTSEGDRTDLLFSLFMLGMFPVTLIANWLCNRSRRRLFPVLLFHASLDASIGYYFGKFQSGELRPFALWIALIWAVGALLYWRVGPRLGLIPTVAQDNSLYSGTG
jgi:uncharacterized protein